MNQETREELKAELLLELSKEIKQQVEDEVEEEIEEEIDKRSKYQNAVNRFKVNFIAIAATIMALGQFSEAVTLIEDGVDSLRSRFTNTVEYELIADIHVNNTEAYIESLLGEPQVSKSISEGVEAKYFHQDKFLATVFISDARVVAYTIIPLIPDFTPTLIDVEGKVWSLQEATYAEFPSNPKMYMVDHSKTTSYYLESLDSGRAGLFVQDYLGNISLDDAPSTNLLVELYNNEVNGSDEEILASQNRYRESAMPNLFGMGTLGLEDIQKSILTGAEFASYFGD